MTLRLFVRRLFFSASLTLAAGCVWACHDSPSREASSSDRKALKGDLSEKEARVVDVTAVVSRSIELRPGPMLASGLGLNEAIRSGGVRHGEKDLPIEQATIQAARAREIGANLVRVHSFGSPSFCMMRVKEAAGDFSNHDALIQIIQEAGLEPIILLGPWPGNRTEDLAPNGKYLPDEEEYRAYVREIVERYDGDGVSDAEGLLRPVRYYEADNEPDIHYKGSLMAARGGSAGQADEGSETSRRGKGEKGGKGGKGEKGEKGGRGQRSGKAGDQERGSRASAREIPARGEGFEKPTDYAKVFLWTASAAVESDEQAIVLPAGLFTIANAFGADYLAQLLEVPGVEEASPVINIHVYPRGVTDGTLGLAIANVRAVSDKPIWLTETSISSGTPGSTDGVGQRMHAAMVARTVLVAMANGVEVVLWHSLNDPPAVYDPNYNRMAASNSLFVGREDEVEDADDGRLSFTNIKPKLGGLTFQKLASVLSDVPYDGITVLESAKGTSIIQLQHEDGRFSQVVWASLGASASVRVELQAPRGTSTATLMDLVPEGDSGLELTRVFFPIRDDKLEGGVVTLIATAEPVLVRFLE